MNTTRKVNRALDLNVLHSFLWTSLYRKWSTSLEITAYTGLSGVTIRAVCQAYPNLFVSSVYGYKLASYATKDEIQNCVATLLSRSAKMIARASALSGRLT